VKSKLLRLVYLAKALMELGEDVVIIDDVLIVYRDTAPKKHDVSKAELKTMLHSLKHYGVVEPLGRGRYFVFKQALISFWNRLKEKFRKGRTLCLLF